MDESCSIEIDSAETEVRRAKMAELGGWRKSPGMRGVDDGEKGLVKVVTDGGSGWEGGVA